MDKYKQNFLGKVKEDIWIWNLGDVLLYDVFNKMLWKMIKEEGDDFFNDFVFF